MKNILVSFDSSTASLRAFGFALEIAALNQGKIIALRVVNLTPIYIKTLEMNSSHADSMSIFAEPRQQTLTDFEEFNRKANAGNVPVTKSYQLSLRRRVELSVISAHQYL